MERAPIGALLVGPNALLREGVARILSVAEFRILASASCVTDLGLESLPKEEPLLLVIDVGDHFDTAMEQIELFKGRFTAGRVVVLAHQKHAGQIVSAFRVGANAFFVEIATCEAFIKTLELVMLGETVLPQALLPLILDRMSDDDHEGNGGSSRESFDEEDSDYDSDDVEAVADRNGVDSMARDGVLQSSARNGHIPHLSARQMSILRCLIEGDSNKTIARKIAIAEATVKVHVKAILRKIRVHNRTQAAIWAMNHSEFAPLREENPSLPEKLPIHPSPGLNGARTLSNGGSNGSASLPELKLEGARHVALAGIRSLARKSGNGKAE